jgi:hypothetical protein
MAKVRRDGCLLCFSKVILLQIPVPSGPCPTNESCRGTRCTRFKVHLLPRNSHRASLARARALMQPAWAASGLTASYPSTIPRNTR